jgi:AcrR family transcriptional regulator
MVVIGTQSVESMGTQERILANALQHFCSYGYNGTSVREITAASKVTKPTLYYYFKNKEELFTKLAQYCFDLVLNKLDECLDSSADFETSLKSLFNCMNQVVSANPAALKFIHSVTVAPQRGAPEVGALAFYKRVEDHLNTILNRAVEKGECVVDKRDLMHLAFLALLGYHIRTTVTAVYGPTNEKTFETLLKSLVKCSGNATCPAQAN